MPFQGDRPEISTSALASATSAAAQEFYSKHQAAAYTTPANANIQRDLTIYALELAQAVAPLETVGTEPIVLLDVGAGSGLSTRAASQWLDARGLDSFCVAFDISASMLLLTTTNDGEAEAVQVRPDGKKIITGVDCGTHTTFYCGNAAQRFPLRHHACDMALGISMLQWLNDNGLRTCYTSLVDVLHDESAAVFQVYPATHDQVTSMETLALEAGFAYAEVVTSFPHSNVGRKWFLVLKKSVDPSRLATLRMDQRDQELCPFGRRHHRRCAWHLFDHNCGNTVLRERLGREHVNEAWRIWRKSQRVEAIATQVAESGKPLHPNAKRSLELWKSDEIIGEALREWFLATTEAQREKDGNVSTTTKITREFLLSQVDEVVKLVHEAYSKAVAIERSLVPPPMSSS